MNKASGVVGGPRSSVFGNLSHKAEKPGRPAHGRIEITRHCLNRFVARRMSPRLTYEDLPIRLRTTIQEVIAGEVAQARLLATLGDQRSAELSHDWVCIIEARKVITVLRRAKGFVAATINRSLREELGIVV